MDKEIIKIRIATIRDNLESALAAHAANTYTIEAFIHRVLDRLEILEKDFEKSDGQDE